VLPKYATTCTTDCACEPAKNSFQQKFSFWIFWVGLVASIIFFTYFEYQNYQANTTAKVLIKTEQIINSTKKTMPTDTTETEKPCCSEGQKCE
jgi:predicted negative regulator of RcsB-dependent stress response